MCHEQRFVVKKVLNFAKLLHIGISTLNTSAFDRRLAIKQLPIPRAQLRSGTAGTGLQWKQRQTWATGSSDKKSSECL